MLKPRVRVRGSSGSNGGALVAQAVRDYSLAQPSPMLSSIMGGYPSSTGTPVTPLSSLQSAAVWGCVKAISEDIAKLPVVVKRRTRGGYWAEDHDHPVCKVLFSPNRWQTWFEFARYLVASVALKGNGVAIVKRGWKGAPEALIPAMWDRVSIMMSPMGWLFYNISHPVTGFGVTFRQEDIIHVKGGTFDGGYVGTSPINASQDAVGLSIAAQMHGAILFRQGAQIAGVLVQPEGTTLSDGARDRIRDEWKLIYGGVQNSHRVAVLEGGLKYEPLQMTNEEAQFLLTRQFQVLEICRLFRVPPHKVFDLSRATFSNIESSEQQYINDTLHPMAANIEALLRMTLFSQDEWSEYRVEFSFDELLRGDRKSRYEAHGLAIDKGILSINEVRMAEGLPPIAGGDEHRVQVNTAPVGSAVAGGNGGMTLQTPQQQAPRDPEDQPEDSPLAPRDQEEDQMA